MLRLCATLELCQLKNHLKELGLQGIGIRILALTILVISMHGSIEKPQNNYILYDIHIFLIGMSLYWILGELVNGRYKRGIRLGGLFTSLSKIIPQNALEIFELSKIDILIKQWFSLIFGRKTQCLFRNVLACCVLFSLSNFYKFLCKRRQN